MWQFVLNRAQLMLAQATSPEMTASPVPMEQFEHTPWHTILLIIYFVVCLALVVAVLLQTTKSEGLSGIIGGSSSSVFKGKKGLDEHLQEWTSYVAVGYIVLSLLITFLAFRVK
ncbi:MAG: preprotein translocase subunit SecG [Vulcanimicrobiota bacterium]